MSRPPFSIDPVSTFNRFSTDEMVNDFIGGAIVLVILVELSNIFHAMLYGTAALDKRAINRYTIFERLANMRHLLPLFTGRESPVHYHTDEAPNIMQRNAPISRNYAALFVPTLAVFLLMAAEFASIYAGTTTPSQVTANTNFDPLLALSTTAERTSLGNGCDDYFVPSRGLRQAGKVLKCVTNISVPGNPLATRDGHTISLKSTINSNTHMFVLRTGEEMDTSVRISIQIRSIGQGTQRMGVFRWDIDHEYVLQLFNGIINGTLEILQLPPNSNVWASSAVLEGTMDFRYRGDIDRSQEEITAALVEQLRKMDLIINSTGAPWVFVREEEYDRRENLIVGIQAFNRVPQGALLILGFTLVVLRTIVNLFFTSFDEVAYIVMQEIIGDDCVVGPLAANPRLTAQEVKPCYETDRSAHDHGTSPLHGDSFEAYDFIDIQTSESNTMLNMTAD